MKDIEIICINDASPDGCGKILAEYAQKDSRIRVISFSQNKGPSAARNVGLASAQGAYVAFCDSDDYMHPEMLQILYREIKKGDSDVAYCLAHLVEESAVPHFEKIGGYWMKKYYVTQELERQTLLDPYFVVVWNKLYKKSAIGSTKFDEELFYAEDSFFNYSLFDSSKKYVIVHEKLYYWRRSSNSVTRKPCTYKCLDSIRKYLEKIQKIKTISEPLRVDICLGQLCWMLDMNAKYGTQESGEFFAILDILNAAHEKNIIRCSKLMFKCLKVHLLVEYCLQKLPQWMRWER
jgi:glycosyltransferase involved in cell wall biosynthesis